MFPTVNFSAKPIENLYAVCYIINNEIDYKNIHQPSKHSDEVLP